MPPTTRKPQNPFGTKNIRVNLGDGNRTVPVSTVSRYPLYFFPEYEEQIISMDYTENLSFNFTASFTSVPIVVVDIYPPSQSVNVLPLLTNVSITGSSVAFSAPFSGSIRYKAIHSDGYPARVNRAPLFQDIFSLASATSTNIVADTSSSTSYIQFSDPATLPSEIGLSILGEDMVYVENTNIDTQSIGAQTSSPTTSVLNYVLLRDI